MMTPTENLKICMLIETIDYREDGRESMYNSSPRSKIGLIDKDFDVALIDFIGS